MEGIVDLMDPVPAFPQLQERVLHEVGGLVTVSGDEAQRPEQRAVIVLEKGRKSRGAAGRSGS